MKPLKTVTSINGKLVKRGQDKISVFDNSLLYAEGLFETCLAIDNNILFLKEHLKRLKKGAGVLGIKIPVDNETLSKWMHQTINKHPDRIKKLRLTLTAGEAARWVGIPGAQQVILSASPHEMPTKLFKLHLSEFRIDQESEFRRIKTISYAIHAAALNQAKKAGCDDALLLNKKNKLAEVTSANIFWVKNKTIYTPPLTAGCLEGITRQTVIKEARKLGFVIKIAEGKVEDLFKADEVFISSSLKLVVGVSSLKIKNKSHKLNRGEITNQLSNHFLEIANLN